jgi:hypothetical protein
MDIVSYQKVKTITKKLDSTSTGTIVIYENTGQQNELPNTSVISVNGFIKNLKAFSRISSLDPITMPEITDDDSDTQKLYKLLDVEWTSPRKQLDLLISDGGDWAIVGSISLLNPSGYPYRTYSIQDLYTDNLAIEIGINGKLGVRVLDAGYGLLSGTDTVTIFGSYVEEICVTPLSQIESTTPFGAEITNTSSIIIAANNNRKYIAITNNSEQDTYLNLGATAFLNQGIYLAANGGSYEISTNQIPYFGAISAITNTTATLAGLESV